MRILSLLLFSFCAASALAQECVPKFYNSEPRDAEWFYGAGKGPDAAKAREDAFHRLAAKVGVKEPLAAELLAGWEQDDHGECGAEHYALIRIEQERVRKNREGLPPEKKEAAGPGIVNNSVVNNNVVISSPAPSSERLYILLAVFLAFVVACIALVNKPKTVSYFYQPPQAGARRAPMSSGLSERFKAVPRQPQREAIAEIARLGLPEYFRVHKGEGTCRAIPGNADLLQAGVLELLRPYAAGGWKVTWEENCGFAISDKQNLVMGFAFFLYDGAEPGNVDCEIMYEISAPIEDAYRSQMEEGLHQGLPWVVQSAAGRLAAARSKDAA